MFKDSYFTIVKVEKLKKMQEDIRVLTFPKIFVEHTFGR